MKKYLIIAALMTAGIVHAEITQSCQIGGLLSDRDYHWNSGRIVFADSIDNQLVFTVTAVANHGDKLVKDFSYLGVDSSARQTDTAANRISNDESITITVSYVDPNGVLTGLKVKEFGAFWGTDATETTVFTDASLKRKNLVSFNHESGALVDYATSGLDALTKDNTGSWSITVSAGNAATTTGLGGLKLEYTTNQSLPEGDYVIEEWNFTGNSLTGVNGTNLIWFGSDAGKGSDETGGTKNNTYTVNRKAGYSGTELAGMDISAKTAKSLTVSMSIASWDLSRSGGNGEFIMRLLDSSGADILWVKFADSLPAPGAPMTTLKGAHFVDGVASYKSGGYIAQGNSGTKPITVGVTLDLVNETYTYWMGDMATDDGSAWNNRFGEHTGSFPGLSTQTIDRLSWAIEGINDSPVTAAPSGDFIEFDQIKLSAHRKASH